MPIGSNGSYTGFLTLGAFALSVIAAVMAIDMFRLLRTGQTGRSWRVLIIASVIFALMQALRLGEYFDWKTLNKYALSQIVELIFALALAYAFYLQRKAFSAAPHLRPKEEHSYDEEPQSVEDDPDNAGGTALDTDWSRLSSMGSLEDSDIIRPLSRESAPEEPLSVSVESERRSR